MENNNDYKHGFSIKIDQELIPKGLSLDIIKKISFTKGEPDWLLEFRTKAFHFWEKSDQPNWAKLSIKPINYQDIIYYAGLKAKQEVKSLGELKSKWVEKLK